MEDQILRIYSNFVSIFTKYFYFSKLIFGLHFVCFDLQSEKDLVEKDISHLENNHLCLKKNHLIKEQHFTFCFRLSCSLSDFGEDLNFHPQIGYLNLNSASQLNFSLLTLLLYSASFNNRLNRFVDWYNQLFLFFHSCYLCLNNAKKSFWLQSTLIADFLNLFCPLRLYIISASDLIMNFLSFSFSSFLDLHLLYYCLKYCWFHFLVYWDGSIFRDDFNFRFWNL